MKVKPVATGMAGLFLAAGHKVLSFMATVQVNNNRHNLVCRGEPSMSSSTLPQAVTGVVTDSSLAMAISSTAVSATLASIVMAMALATRLMA